MHQVKARNEVDLTWLKGDRCMCPIQGHTVCVIAEGDPKVLIDGVPVAFEGHKTTCGASLISTVPKSGKG